MTWNERTKFYNEVKSVRCLWKDVNIDAWDECSNHFKSYIKAFEKLEIDLQSAVISRIVYKHNNQMRRDKPFQLFKKVNRFVSKYCEIKLLQNMIAYQDILIALKSNCSSLTKDIFVPEEGFTVFLIELVIGSYHLAGKIVEACKQAFISLDSHMRYGFFVSFNFFAIASVSRLWSVFKEVQNLSRLFFDTFKQILHNCHCSSNMSTIELEDPDKGNAVDRIINTDLKQSIQIESKDMESTGEAISRCTENDGQRTKDIMDKFVPQNCIVKLEIAVNVESTINEDIGEIVRRKDGNDNADELEKSIKKNIEKSVTEKSNERLVQVSLMENSAEERAFPIELDEFKNIEEKALTYTKQTTDEVKSSIRIFPFKRKLCPLELGTLQTVRFKQIIPYPTTSLKRAFNSIHNRHVSPKSLKNISKAFKIIKKKAKQLQDVEAVRYALTQSKCIQETIYLVIQLRKLLS